MLAQWTNYNNSLFDIKLFEKRIGFGYLFYLFIAQSYI